MDRNQVIGFVLIAAILGVYMMWFAPEPEDLPLNENTEIVTTDSTVISTPQETQLVATDTVAPDSLVDLQQQMKYGAFAPFINKEEVTFTVTSNVGRYVFSTKGGLLSEVELTQHKTYSKEPLILFDKQTHQEQLLLQTKDGKIIDINTLQFSTSSLNDASISETGDSLTLTFDVAISSSQHIKKIYTIYQDRYDIAHSLQFEGLDAIASKEPLRLIVNDKARLFEKDLKQARYGSFVGYYLQEDDDFDDLGERSLGNEQELVPAIQWFALKQKYFTKSYIAKNGFANADISMTTDESQKEFTKDFAVKAAIDYETLVSGKQNFILYYGPSDYNILKEVGYDLEQNVYLGWLVFRQINEYLILPLFNFIRSIFGNYGLIIFILVLIIKIVIFPFTFKSYKGFAKMRVLKPELDELKEKYKDDQTKFQQEQMKVYQKFGVSPLSGCIPILFQMPFLLALFQLFPNVFALRGQSFLWAEDLSTYDAFFSWETEIIGLGNHISLFTLMMTLSTLAYTYISQQIQPQASAPGQPNMKVMSYMMPVIFFFVLNDYASGLTYYYFLSNLITIGQQLISKKFINEEQILAKMKEYSKKSGDGKKKNSFSKRLEEAMKAQQAKQSQQKKK